METCGLRLRALAERLFQNKEEKECVFQGNPVKLTQWLKKDKSHRVSFSYDGRVPQFVLITLSNDDVKNCDATEILIERLDSGKTLLDGEHFPGKRHCFVCNSTASLQWTSLACSEISPRAQLLVFTCSIKCREAFRNK